MAKRQTRLQLLTFSLKFTITSYKTKTTLQGDWNFHPIPLATSRVTNQTTQRTSCQCLTIVSRVVVLGALQTLGVEVGQQGSYCAAIHTLSLHQHEQLKQTVINVHPRCRFHSNQSMMCLYSTDELLKTDKPERPGSRG